jgi:diaminopimelate epimerase
MKVSFTKMHGAGNDYIYVNAMQFPIADPVKASILWSDRHKGIGSDGLVLIDKSTVP